jgi:hypothetical protein
MPTTLGSGVGLLLPYRAVLLLCFTGLDNFHMCTGGGGGREELVALIC